MIEETKSTVANLQHKQQQQQASKKPKCVSQSLKLPQTLTLEGNNTQILTATPATTRTNANIVRQPTQANEHCKQTTKVETRAEVCTCQQQQHQQQQQQQPLTGDCCNCSCLSQKTAANKLKISDTHATSVANKTDSDSAISSTCSLSPPVAAFAYASSESSITDNCCIVANCKTKSANISANKADASISCQLNETNSNCVHRQSPKQLPVVVSGCERSVEASANVRQQRACMQQQQQQQHHQATPFSIATDASNSFAYERRAHYNADSSLTTLPPPPPPLPTHPHLHYNQQQQYSYNPSLTCGAQYFPSSSYQPPAYYYQQQQQQQQHHHHHQYHPFAPPPVGANLYYSPQPQPQPLTPVNYYAPHFDAQFAHHVAYLPHLPISSTNYATDFHYGFPSASFYNNVDDSNNYNFGNFRLTAPPQQQQQQTTTLYNCQDGDTGKNSNTFDEKQQLVDETTQQETCGVTSNEKPTTSTSSHVASNHQSLAQASELSASINKSNAAACHNKRLETSGSSRGNTVSASNTSIASPPPPPPSLNAQSNFQRCDNNQGGNCLPASIRIAERDTATSIKLDKSCALASCENLPATQTCKTNQCSADSTANATATFTNTNNNNNNNNNDGCETLNQSFDNNLNNVGANKATTKNNIINNFCINSDNDNNDADIKILTVSNKQRISSTTDSSCGGNNGAQLEDNDDGDNETSTKVKTNTKPGTEKPNIEVSSSEAITMQSSELSSCQKDLIYASRRSSSLPSFSADDSYETASDEDLPPQALISQCNYLPQNQWHLPFNSHTMLQPQGSYASHHTTGPPRTSYLQQVPVASPSLQPLAYVMYPPTLHHPQQATATTNTSYVHNYTRPLQAATVSIDASGGHPASSDFSNQKVHYQQQLYSPSYNHHPIYSDATTFANYKHIHDSQNHAFSQLNMQPNLHTDSMHNNKLVLPKTTGGSIINNNRLYQQQQQQQHYYQGFNNRYKSYVANRANVVDVSLHQTSANNYADNIKRRSSSSYLCSDVSSGELTSGTFLTTTPLSSFSTHLPLKKSDLISVLPIEAEPTRVRQAYGMDKVWADEFEKLFSEFNSNSKVKTICVDEEEEEEIKRHKDDDLKHKSIVEKENKSSSINNSQQTKQVVDDKWRKMVWKLIEVESNPKIVKHHQHNEAFKSYGLSVYALQPSLAQQQQQLQQRQTEFNTNKEQEVDGVSSETKQQVLSRKSSLTNNVHLVDDQGLKINSKIENKADNNIDIEFPNLIANSPVISPITLSTPSSSSLVKKFPTRLRMFIDSAKVRFCCDYCGHGWTSMKGRVVFWYELFEVSKSAQQRQTTTLLATKTTTTTSNVNSPSSLNTEELQQNNCCDSLLSSTNLIGYCAFKLFGQQCDNCKLENCFERPMWYPEEVRKVLTNLYNKIGQIYLGFEMPTIDKQRRAGKPKTAHNSSLCQACFDGVCTDRK